MSHFTFKMRRIETICIENYDGNLFRNSFKNYPTKLFSISNRDTQNNLPQHFESRAQHSV